MYVWLPHLLTPVGQTKEVHAVSSADSAVRCRRWMFLPCPIKMQRVSIISVSCNVCVSSPYIRNVNTESSSGLLGLKRTLQESYTKAGFFVWVSAVSGYLQQKGDPPVNSPFVTVHICCIDLRQCEETKSLVRKQTWNCRYKTLRCRCCPYRKV